MCTAAAVVGGIGQGLSAIGQSQAIKAQNEQARRNWEYRMETRKRNWLQQLSIYKERKNKYAIDLNENDMAAQRGYTKAKLSLDNQMRKALGQNRDAYIKLIQKVGKSQAAGRTGVSARRRLALEMASYGRYTAKQSYALTHAQEAYNSNVRSIRRAQVSARNKLFSQVAFAPVPDVAPPPPVMQNSSLPLLAGIVGAIGSGMKTANDMKIQDTGLGGQSVWDVPSLSGSANDFPTFDIPWDGGGGSSWITDAPLGSFSQITNFGNNPFISPY